MKTNKLLQKIIALSILSIAHAATILSLTSCSTTASIQIANFESYMDKYLKADLKNKYNCQFQYYQTNELLESKFKDYYDVAVCSSYELMSLYRQGLIEKYDWRNLSVQYLDDVGTLHDVVTSDDAKHLFSENLIDNLNAFYTYDALDVDKKNFNILDWGIPYFLQNIMFAYKGETEVPFYKHGTIEVTNDPDWEDITYTISPANPNLDPRFKPIRNQRTCMLDDGQAIYNIARLCETANKDAIMPENATISDIKTTFNKLTQYFTNKSESWFYLNSDSGWINRTLADPNGANGAIAYNGDILYSAVSGSDEYDPYNAGNFHVQKAKAEIQFVDLVVLNKNRINKSPRPDDIYNIIKQMVLDGCNQAPKIDGIGQINEDGTQKYWAMRNFQTIWYTPPLKSMYKYIVNVDSDYWNEFRDKSWSDEMWTKTKELYIEILSLKENDGIASQRMTHLQFSNLHWGWSESKEKF